MRISEKQLIVMLDILRGTLGLTDTMGLISFSKEVRLEIYNQILSQASDELVEIGGIESAD